MSSRPVPGELFFNTMSRPSRLGSAKAEVVRQVESLPNESFWGFKTLHEYTVGTGKQNLPKEMNSIFREQSKTVQTLWNKWPKLMSQPRQDALKLEGNTSSGDTVLLTTPVGILILENWWYVWSSQWESGRRKEIGGGSRCWVEERKMVESGWTLAFEREAVGGFGGGSQLTSSICSSSMLIRAISKLGSVEQLCRTVKKQWSLYYQSLMSGSPPTLS